MSIRFKNLHIKNFKSFKDVFIDFSNADLVVLDGPNGFGKTTVYDAIELLINGRINRYERLYEETVDGRCTYSEHPYLCEYSTSGDLEIISEIFINNSSVTLKRAIERKSLESNFSIPDTTSFLFVTDMETGVENKKVEDEEKFYKDLLGENYASNFEFITYVEQEENLSFLKQKDSDRKNKIGYLFNTIEYDNKIEKLKLISSKLAKLTSSAVLEELKTQKNEIEEIEKSIIAELDDVEYFQLIKDKEVIWDKEIIPFDSFT